MGGKCSCKAQAFLGLSKEHVVLGSILGAPNGGDYGGFTRISGYLRSSQWGCRSGRTIDDDINRKQSAKVERIGKSYVHWVSEGQRHCAHAESHLRVVLIILVKFLTLSAK